MRVRVVSFNFQSLSCISSRFEVDIDSQLVALNKILDGEEQRRFCQHAEREKILGWRCNQASNYIGRVDIHLPHRPMLATDLDLGLEVG